MIGKHRYLIFYILIGFGLLKAASANQSCDIHLRDLDQDNLSAKVKQSIAKSNSYALEPYGFGTKKVLSYTKEGRPRIEIHGFYVFLKLKELIQKQSVGKLRYEENRELRVLYRAVTEFMYGITPLNLDNRGVSTITLAGIRTPLIYPLTNYTLKPERSVTFKIEDTFKNKNNISHEIDIWRIEVEENYIEIRTKKRRSYIVIAFNSMGLIQTMTVYQPGMLMEKKSVIDFNSESFLRPLYSLDKKAYDFMVW